MGTMRLVVDAQDESPPFEVPAERLAEVRGNPSTRIWLDLQDPDDEDVAMLGREFGFHPVALAEVTRPHERPRCDAYSGYYFIVVYAAELPEGEFRPRELNLFWGPSYLVTIRRCGECLDDLLAKARVRWENHEAREAHGVATLAYTLFESLVDGYFAVQDGVRRRIDEIQEAIFRGDEGAAADLFTLRKELLEVPRLLGPTSHVLAEVLRRDQAVPDALRPYFADAQDHAVHLLAELDTHRDLLGAALDVQVFYAFTRLGHIMKRLTAITVIIMVPTFVSSIYGMNFEILWPPSGWALSFPIVVVFLGIMVAWGFLHSKILGWL
jgi:magnesium transporter